MSRGARKQSERNGGEGAGGSRTPRTGLAAGVGVAFLVLMVGVGWVGLGFSAGNHHPEPRQGITGGTVVPATRYASYPRVKEVYSQAVDVASTLDGLHCYCDCARHSGHRSLLTCFESDHGAACDICLSEAAIAYRMTKDGRSLDEIRDAIDEMYGS